MSKSVAIIGSGLGGLSAAIRLAIKGFNVKVFEQSGKPGGKASEIIGDGFRFDAGPSLLTMPFIIEVLFNEAGKNLNDYITLKRPDITCKYFYPDKTIINAYNDVNKFAEEIESKTKDDAEDVKKYLRYSKQIYDLTADLFLYNSPSNFSTFTNKKALKTLFNISQIDSFRTMHQANSSFFKDERIIQLFDRYATYNGSNPYDAPATLNIIQHVEYNLGSYIPESGIYSIVNAMYKLAEEKGVVFKFNSKVEEIIIENKKAVGIKTRTGGERFDFVVSNADVNFTFSKLLNNYKSKEAERYKKLEPSLSGLVFYLGVKGIYPELETHNILFSENYRKEFEDIFVKKIIPEDPTIYIYISSKFNKTDAPNDCENWFVMVNTPYDSGQNWDKQINITRNRVINKIKSYLNIDLTEKIIFEERLDPVKLQANTSSWKGSIYGISSNSKSAAFLRQNNKSKTIKSLYFCGGSAHPGGGIPLVILSGKIAAELIEKDCN